MADCFDTHASSLKLVPFCVIFLSCNTKPKNCIFDLQLKSFSKWIINCCIFVSVWALLCSYTMFGMYNCCWTSTDKDLSSWNKYVCLYCSPAPDMTLGMLLLYIYLNEKEKNLTRTQPQCQHCTFCTLG